MLLVLGVGVFGYWVVTGRGVYGTPRKVLGLILLVWSIAAFFVTVCH